MIRYLFFLVVAHIIIFEVTHTVCSQTLRVNERQVIFFYEPPSATEIADLQTFLKSELPRQELFFNYALTDSVFVYLYTPQNYRTLQHEWRIPDWGQALAVPDKNLIILNSRSADKVTIYSNLRQVLSHELAHIIVAKKTTDSVRAVPVWFNEGCALWISGERRPLDMLSRAVMTNSLIAFDDIEYVLRYDSYRAELAYDQSLSATLYLVQQHQESAITRILESMNAENEFNQSFFMVTGRSVYQFEREWEEQLKPVSVIEWTRYADTILWIILIPLLFLIAIMIKWIRARKKLSEWEKEDETE